MFTAMSLRANMVAVRVISQFCTSADTMRCAGKRLCPQQRDILTDVAKGRGEGQA